MIGRVMGSWRKVGPAGSGSACSGAWWGGVGVVLTASRDGLEGAAMASVSRDCCNTRGVTGAVAELPVLSREWVSLTLLSPERVVASFLSRERAPVL